MLYSRTLLLALLFSCVSLCGQEDNYRVGLVLSGGGALGYAHIGALQVIEEAGIRIDYIGGTSMGSIVGGLYATGYRADSLEAMLRRTDILGILEDRIGRNDRKIYDKLYNEHYIIGLSLKNFSPQLPAALSNGQRVRDLFSHWTADVHQARDFSKLPIPFLAVGTDVVSGNAVLLESGSLPDAMRASAALPGALSPHRIGEVVMTDGGLANNYPAEEVKAKGMDYLIGVTVEQDPFKAGEVTSLDKLLLQIAFFQANRRNVDQYAVTDLDIDPELGGYSQLSFEAIDSLVAAGRAAARQQLPLLREIAARQAGDTPRPPVKRTIPASLNATVVEISGNEELSRRQVLGYFGGRLPGRIQWTDFREDLVALLATGRYTNISYDWEPIPGTEDEVQLFLRLEPAPGFGQQLRLGLHYDQVYRANIMVGLTVNDLLFDNSLTTLDLIGGSRFRYRFDYRINRSSGAAIGLRSRSHFSEVTFQFAESVSIPNQLTLEALPFRFNDISAELYWDFRQTTNSFTGLAGGLQYYRTTSDLVEEVTSDSGFTLGDDLFFVPRVYFLYDKRDDNDFPLRGFSIDAVGRAVLNLESRAPNGDRPALNADLNFTGLLPLTRRVSLGLDLRAGGFTAASALPYRYYLGSNNRNLMNNFVAFPGLDLGQASGEGLLMGECFLRYTPATSHFFTLGGRLAQLEQTMAIPSSIRTKGLYAGRLAYGYASPLGPIELTYAYGNDGGRLYFNLGYWF